MLARQIGVGVATVDRVGQDWRHELTDKTTAYQGKTFVRSFFLQNGEGRCHHNRFAKLTDTAV
ncbi:hypothetical protein CKJ90_29185 [Klebsiella pneumoniae]|nr:hypothetical protein CKJ90_29185 [Klebsiella pneumoniae]